MSDDPIERRIAWKQIALKLRGLEKAIAQAAQILEERLGLKLGDTEEVLAAAALLLQVPVAELLDWPPAELLASLQSLESNLSAPALANERRRKLGKGRSVRDQLITALATHHQYENGSILNQEPVGVRELAALAKVSPSTVTEFFQAEFAGHDAYKRCCRDKSKLIAALKLLLQEFSPRLLLSPQALNSISVEDNPGGDNLDEN
jgi:hypothetical protein